MMTKVGRPQKFKDVKELQDKIDVYFEQCVCENKPFTVTGLALALDTTRETLCDYEEKPEFSDAIKKAKAKVEQFAEERLYLGAPAGAIFALKNFGWSDKQTLEQQMLDKNGNKADANLKVEFVNRIDAQGDKE